MALVTLSLEPGMVTRMRALRQRRGYKIQAMANDALRAHLDALEGLEVKPVQAPARFKRARQRAAQNEKSIFAPLLDQAPPQSSTSIAHSCATLQPANT